MAPCLAAGAGDGPTWSQWRGPGRDGAAPEAISLPGAGATWQEVWQVEVGTGHSSPVVGDDRVFTLTRQGDREVLACRSLEDGELLWQHDQAVEIGINPYADDHGRWPRATPVVFEGHVLALGIAATLVCADTETGEVVWRSELGPVDCSNLFCGTSSSPLVWPAGDGARLYVHVGDDGGGRLLALDPASGEELARWTGEGPGYSSPVVHRTDRGAQLVTMTQSRVIALDASSLELLWSIPFDDKWNENIVTPVVHGDVVIFAGVRRGTFAVRPTWDGAAWQPEEVWSNREVPLYMSSPVVVGERLLGFTNRRRGQLVALGLADGEVTWQHGESLGDNAALVALRDGALVQTTDGVVSVLAAKDAGFEVKGTLELDGSPWAHPVPLQDGLLVKDSNMLGRWSVSEAE